MKNFMRQLVLVWWVFWLAVSCYFTVSVLFIQDDMQDALQHSLDASLELQIKQLEQMDRLGKM